MGTIIQWNLWVWHWLWVWTPCNCGLHFSWAQKNPILSKVVQLLQQGWPSHGEPSMTPFLFINKDRAITVWRSYFVGITCGGYRTRKEGNADVTAWRTSGNVSYESTYKNVRLVVRDQCRHWRVSEWMLWMSIESVYTTSSPFESMELAYMSMGIITLRLCWSILRTDVPHTERCTF